MNVYVSMNKAGSWSLRLWDLKATAGPVHIFAILTLF